MYAHLDTVTMQPDTSCTASVLQIGRFCGSETSLNDIETASVAIADVTAGFLVQRRPELRLAIG